MSEKFAKGRQRPEFIRKRVRSMLNIDYYQNIEYTENNINF